MADAPKTSTEFDPALVTAQIEKLASVLSKDAQDQLKAQLPTLVPHFSKLSDGNPDNDNEAREGLRGAKKPFMAVLEQDLASNPNRGVILSRASDGIDSFAAETEEEREAARKRTAAAATAGDPMANFMQGIFVMILTMLGVPDDQARKMVGVGASATAPEAAAQAAAAPAADSAAAPAAAPAATPTVAPATVLKLSSSEQGIVEMYKQEMARRPQPVTSPGDYSAAYTNMSGASDDLLAHRAEAKRLELVNALRTSNNNNFLYGNLPDGVMLTFNDQMKKEYFDAKRAYEGKSAPVDAISDIYPNQSGTDAKFKADAIKAGAARAHAEVDNTFLQGRIPVPPVDLGVRIVDNDNLITQQEGVIANALASRNQQLETIAGLKAKLELNQLVADDGTRGRTTYGAFVLSPWNVHSTKADLLQERAEEAMATDRASLNTAMAELRKQEKIIAAATPELMKAYEEKGDLEAKQAWSQGRGPLGEVVTTMNAAESAIKEKAAEAAKKEKLAQTDRAFGIGESPAGALAGRVNAAHSLPSLGASQGGYSESESYGGGDRYDRRGGSWDAMAYLTSDEKRQLERLEKNLNAAQGREVKFEDQIEHSDAAQRMHRGSLNATQGDLRKTESRYANGQLNERDLSSARDYADSSKQTTLSALAVNQDTRNERLNNLEETQRDIRGYKDKIQKLQEIAEGRHKIELLTQQEQQATKNLAIVQDVQKRIDEIAKEVSSGVSAATRDANPVEALAVQRKALSDQAKSLHQRGYSELGEEVGRVADLIQRSYTNTSDRKFTPDELTAIRDAASKLPKGMQQAMEKAVEGFEDKQADLQKQLKEAAAGLEGKTHLTRKPGSEGAFVDRAVQAGEKAIQDKADGREARLKDASERKEARDSTVRNMRDNAYIEEKGLELKTEVLNKALPADRRDPYVRTQDVSGVPLSDEPVARPRATPNPDAGAPAPKGRDGR